LINGFLIIRSRRQAALTIAVMPEYGEGFVRIEGSSACVRIGGGLSVANV
jgi:hypothetical protein